MENYKVSECNGGGELGSKRRSTETMSGMARCGKARGAKKECRWTKVNNKCIIKR